MQGCDVIANSSLSTSDKIYPVYEIIKMDTYVLQELCEQDWLPTVQ